ncbi:MAG: nucleotidyltransferase domain-containing protein [Candidatus Micrarchaeia archaeon]
MLEKYAVIKAMKKILAFPNTKFSISRLAKETGLAVSAASYSLEYMEGEGLVTKEVVGRTHLYKADLESFLARQWKIVFSLQELHENRIVEKILSKMDNVSNILLYGSVACGTDDEKSDIDIIVIAEGRKKKAIDEATVGGRELNLAVYTPLEWKKKAENEKAFYDNAVTNSISLNGEKPVVL